MKPCFSKLAILRNKMFHYHDMNSGEFETLVILICKEILGQGTQGFSAGRDGGRDAKFHGKADLYPSRSSPWEGITIIQAKHTNGIDKSYNDTGFFSATSKTCTVAQEVKKIVKLIDEQELDSYMLFANRKLSGGTQAEITSYLANETGLDLEKIGVLGRDDLNMFLGRYKYMVDMVNLTPLTKAPIIRPSDLADLIEEFAKVFDRLAITNDFSPVIRTTYAQKNIINNMRDDAAEYYKKQYMMYMHQIDTFLKDPMNQSLQSKYQEAVEEFQIKFIIPKKRDLKYFDEIFDALVDLLVNRDSFLNRNIRLTRIMVFYMYWNCDIGDANSDQP